MHTVLTTAQSWNRIRGSHLIASKMLIPLEQNSAPRCRRLLVKATKWGIYGNITPGLSSATDLFLLQRDQFGAHANAVSLALHSITVATGIAQALHESSSIAPQSSHSVFIVADPAAHSWEESHLNHCIRCIFPWLCTSNKT